MRKLLHIYLYLSVYHKQVKLADVLNKFIVPVSFLESWPPRCLAIQFATTQYVSWKLPAPGMKHGKYGFDML